MPTWDELNNVAEYAGLIGGLRLAFDMGVRRLTVVMDSDLVVGQVMEKVGFDDDERSSLPDLCDAVIGLKRRFTDCLIRQQFRCRNQRADFVAKEAVTRRLGQCVTRQGGGAVGVALLAVDDGCRVGDVHIPLPTRLPPPPPLRVGDDEGLEGNGAVVVNEDEDDLLLVGGGPSARLMVPRLPSVSPM